MSPFINPRSGFFANSVSSIFVVEMSSRMLRIISLGFHGVWMLHSGSRSEFCVNVLFQNFKFFLLLVSISTSPLLSNLKILIPTLISVGFIVAFSNSLIVSGGCLSLDITQFESFQVLQPSQGFRVEFSTPATRWWHSPCCRPCWFLTASKRWRAVFLGHRTNCFWTVDKRWRFVFLGMLAASPFQVYFQCDDLHF